MFQFEFVSRICFFTVVRGTSVVICDLDQIYGQDIIVFTEYPVLDYIDLYRKDLVFTVSMLL